MSPTVLKPWTPDESVIMIPVIMQPDPKDDEFIILHRALSMCRTISNYSPKFFRKNIKRAFRQAVKNKGKFD